MDLGARRRLRRGFRPWDGLFGLGAFNRVRAMGRLLF
jgi:hypothetical protein